MNYGIITIATGKAEYINMAIALGISISLHSPNIPTAIITDSDNEFLKKLYNFIIIPPETKKSGFLLKTSLYDFTPFDRTIFIDSDCLFVAHADEIFNKLKDEEFIVVGDKIETGYWFTDISNLLKQLGLSSLPKFNSGFIYFKKNMKVKQIFKEAQDAFFKQDFYKIETFKGSCPDEPCFAIGMAKEGVEAYSDRERRISYTPIGLKGKFYVDAIRGDAHWYIENIGEVKPIIVHFVSRINFQEYRTECLRLRLFYHGGWKKKAMPVLAFIVYWSIFLRRFLGKIYHKRIICDI